MLYSPNIVRVTSGRSIAHTRRSKFERAALAARLVRGDIELTRLTRGQAAKIAGVAPADVRRALGSSPRVAKRPAPIADLKPSAAKRLEQDWLAATPEDRVRFAREIGVERLQYRALPPHLRRVCKVGSACRAYRRRHTQARSRCRARSPRIRRNRARHELPSFGRRVGSAGSGLLHLSATDAQDGPLPADDRPCAPTRRRQA
jgi:hypothetical protein